MNTLSQKWQLNKVLQMFLQRWYWENWCSPKIPHNWRVQAPLQCSKERTKARKGWLLKTKEWANQTWQQETSPSRRECQVEEEGQGHHLQDYCWGNCGSWTRSDGWPEVLYSFSSQQVAQQIWCYTCKCIHCDSDIPNCYLHTEDKICILCQEVTS